MTPSNPPELAVGLLRRFVPDNEPLTGDLIEQFALGRSRLWFWREALLAIVIHAFQPRDKEHPLGLAESTFPAVPEPAPLSRHVNLTASPLPGIGGLGLVAFGVIVAVARPNAWWIFVPAIVGGVLLGVILVIVRRHAPLARHTPHA